MEAIVELFNRHSRQVTTLASILLVVAMSISVARSVLFFIENIDDEQITASPVQVPRSLGESRSKVDISALNLFGVVQSDAPRVVDAPQTNLNLELQGVFTAEDPDESTAIVAERNKSGQLYTIGERLPGNAILDAVFNDHILIRRGARVEKLMFSDAPLRQQFTPSSTSTGQTGASADSTSRLQDIRERIAERRRQARIARDEDEEEDVAGQPQASIRDRLTAYRERMASDPEGTINEVGLAPVEMGESSGYRVAGNVPAQVLRQTGLQEGDVILSVNGTPVGNAVNDQSLIDSAISAGRVRVEVQRNDRKFFVTVPIPE